MEPSKHWTLEVQQHEDGDYFIEFPDDVLAEADWKEGDVIEWLDNKDGSWTLRKKLDDNHENTDESKE
jgi:hypothetical protein